MYGKLSESTLNQMSCKGIKQMVQDDFLQSFDANKFLEGTTEPIIPFKRFDKKLPSFERESFRNAGFDLFARVDEEAGLLIEPGQVVQIPLNVATEMPSDCVGLLFQRSSTFRKWGIKLTNNCGVIDSLFCGDGDEWTAEFRNETDKQVVVSYGDKICQALFMPLYPMYLVEQEKLGNANRGGFGTSYDNAREISETRNDYMCGFMGVSASSEQEAREKLADHFNTQRLMTGQPLLNPEDIKVTKVIFNRNGEAIEADNGRPYKLPGF